MERAGRRVTIESVGEVLRARRVSVREVTQEALAQIERLNPRINALITVTREAALERADALDREISAGQIRGPLHGIPVVHKDCLYTAGVRTTGGSRIFADFVPDRDAEAVARLDRAGAVTVGKAGMHELAYGVTSNNPHFGAVRNPRDTERIPGGSSGGSAAAIAAGMALGATGTDTGGSIRIPASFCGVVGLKPTYDRVDRAGVMPLSVTLDHVGPMAGTVRDVALMFGVLAERTEAAKPEISGLRIGVPANFFFDFLDAEVAEAVRAAARRAEMLGARVAPVRLPGVEALNVVGRVIQLSEAAAIFERHLSTGGARRGDFGADVLALIEQGRLIPVTDYVNAQRVRRVLAREFAKVWTEVDCLIAPVTPVLPPLIGEMSVTIDKTSPGLTEDVRIACTRLARPLNVLGWPALAMPCGRSRSGLPIGMQLIAAAGREEVLLGLGAALEALLQP
jgi:aspartyl-tRNA(Asn)/glutamyl-tRNA(Gln) amidotransferase subunit A